MLYIIGFMGVGKTTIGKELALKHNINFIDTDKEIEKKSNNSILNIFQEHSESHFRELESITLKEISEDSIVACGGGLPIYNNNMELIKKSGLSIYLKASEKEIFNRLKRDLKNRPLLKNKSNKEIENFIQETLTEREKFYKMADYIIDTSYLSKTNVLGKINALPFWV